uniref:2-oxoglutarate dehydrogenase E1 component n=1 Tax=Candidatus Kentrum sp. FM TaxID=2126340 RepID=A0A450SBV7_9GAMM|nr:MAG: 2-oxoglutarate dehydrogenase E1 component [Candidatus Kentron sp. FM]VFJ49749.1 MAG: 2-oxoglutarate dehydrogenase E1 component [Candidatus Kentron sp. FM]VFK09957.1 MAG: 2-oxoglutarate dehydrogenase E1 component [Candidatus Kentron sp. FM]
MTIHLFDPANGAFLDQLYAAFLQDPASVDERWRDWFRGQESDTEEHQSGEREDTTFTEKQRAVSRLIRAYRFRGHRHARLDPLDLHRQTPAPDLDPAFHGLTESDLDGMFQDGKLFGPSRKVTLREILETVRGIYCGPVGAEYMYLTSTEQKRWIRKRLERDNGTPGEPGFPAEKKRDILKWLTAANEFEVYLHKKYVGQKRFSLEGGESLIPLLDELLQSAGTRHGVREAAIGMAHRGRLNVLVNIFGKNPGLLFGEFEGKTKKNLPGISGDVKYHLGFSSEISIADGHIHAALGFNPSHLEIIDPVVEGSVRARQDRRKDTERNQVLPILIHGDASFAGQGVVMEALNLSGTRGYGTGGTIHIVINNQIGFTTSDPLDSRSTLYCTDVAKMVQAPIFHVNGDHPESVLFVAAIALDYRMRFKKDVVIDMVCYRRHGHNESDEPMATQPLMYKKIAQKPNVRELYAGRLVEEGVLREEDVAQMSEAYLSALENDKIVSRPLVEGYKADYLANWGPYRGTQWDAPTDTAVPIERIEKLGLGIATYPADFVLHRSVARILTARREMALGERPMDWGFAEMLAYATLIEDGYSLRLSGQDSERGTFFHRHAVLHDQEGRGDYRTLEHLFEGQPLCRIVNSLLSEEAVLGFEYGYASTEPESLVIWEAQFGDFCNGAQVVIDQFLSSSEAKWENLCGLVLLLPHGYDGQGPEHSSARLERFLQLAAQKNIQVCAPTTPGQMFHMLRRQMLRPYRKPLVVMSPKSLLRHRLSIATRDELARGGFRAVMDETDALGAEAVVRIVFCTGKVYYDLLEQRRKERLEHVALLRIEQLYPFPREQVTKMLARYPNAVEVVWAQEEPQNQGPWDFVHSRHHLAGLLKPEQRLSYAGRPYAASPATGNRIQHLEEQQALLEKALTSHA